MTFDLSTLLRSLADVTPDRNALVQGSVRRPWAEMIRRTNQLANVLLDHGVGGDVHPADEPWTSTQDHLGVFLLNSPEYLESVVGAHGARVAPFNINYRYTEGELTYLFTDARPKALVYHSRFAPAVDATLRSHGGCRVLLQVADDSGNALLPGALDYETAIANARSGTPPTTPSPDDLHIVYTGGTTGMPKGVLWRIGDLLSGPLGVRSEHGSREADLDAALRRAETLHQTVLPAPPLMHSTGLWFALAALCGGGTVVMQSNPLSLDGQDVVDTCARERVQAMIVVGDSFMQPIVDALRATGAHLPHLELLANSGAALHQQLKAEIRALLPNVRILDMLGATETGVQAARRDDATTFRPQRDHAVVAADFSRRLEPGDDEIGWLAKGGAIPRGYLGDPVKTQANFREVEGVRYAIPGDRVRLEADGTFTLLGRDSMTINTGGEKVFVEEVEDVLRSVRAVVDALVVGQPSERWGEEVTAVVQLEPESDVTDAELVARAGERLARHKLPKRIVRVDRIRRHTNGKADYGWAKRISRPTATQVDSTKWP